ncbi:unnamed protein product [Paramecium octaurelia]|uniref:BART domain-containing protein n=1 Tax=Paramecium octaurelia TaxID=43137 RepID=A0A8S1VXM3_PAROT|nr:unnamed protein product [Paramecium octaurelia]
MLSDYQTVKEVILQMLASPTWKNQYNSFVDEYCIYFDDDKENSIQQNNLFKQFQTEMATIYDSFFGSLGLENTDELQFKIIQEILNSDGEEEIDIQQLLALGDFQVFKAEMSFQNKRREVAAYQLLVVDEEDEEEAEQQEEEEEEVPEAEQFQKMQILKIKLEYQELQEELQLKQAMLISFDTPNQNKLQQISELLEEVFERLQILEIELVLQQNQQMNQNNDRKSKLLAQLNNLPIIDLAKEQEIFTKIKMDFAKI